MATIESPEEEPRTESHKPMAVGRQIALTIKLLAGAAVLIGLLWFIDRAT